MRDYNFFSDLLTARKKNRNKTAIMFSVIGGVILSIGGGYALTELTVYALQKDISSMQAYLNSEEVLEKKLRIEEKKRKIDIVKRYDSAVDKVLADIRKADVIGSSLMADINRAVPADAVFKGIAVAQESLGIQGSAPDRVSIAELLHNLNGLGIFSDVHVANINKVSEWTEAYDFTIQCKLKGGAEE